MGAVGQFDAIGTVGKFLVWDFTGTFGNASDHSESDDRSFEISGSQNYVQPQFPMQF
jgi:hypothetical protein